MGLYTDKLLKMAVTSSQARCIEMAECIAERIDAATDSGGAVAAQHYREVSRVVDAICRLRFPDWSNVSPAQRRDAMLMGDGTGLDARDFAIVAKREQQWAARPGPRVGDFVHMLDGTLQRFTHDWGDNIQTTSPQAGGSFYFADGGFASYSGGLAPAIAKSTLTATEETRPGRFWIFHHGERRAGNGVDITVTCRVFRQT